MTAAAFDQTGAEIQLGAGTVTYSSSASEVAVVSRRGLVSAAAPGKTVITAAFTYEGMTRVASTEATVHQEPAQYPAIAGVYDVEA